MIKIIYDDEQMPEAGLAALFERAAELAAEREGIGSCDCEVSLFFADTDEMRQMNLEYRGIDEPTDVLSFPMQDNGDGSRQKGDVPCVCNKTEWDVPSVCKTGQTLGTSRSVLSAPVMLGDIVICREIAEGQAAEYGHNGEREIAFLFTHGLLHLLGYDHQDNGDGAIRGTPIRGTDLLIDRSIKRSVPLIGVPLIAPSPCVSDMRAAEKEIMEGIGL